MSKGESVGTVGAASSGSLSWAVGGWHGSCKCPPHAGNSAIHSSFSPYSFLPPVVPEHHSPAVPPLEVTHRPKTSGSTSKHNSPAALRDYTAISKAFHPPPMPLTHLQA